MATLYVTEYYLLATVPNNPGQVPQEPPLADYTVSFGSMSPPFQPGTRIVRLHSDAICSVLLGQNPSATTTNGRFAANQTEFRGVPEGQGFRVSVVANT